MCDKPRIYNQQSSGGRTLNHDQFLCASRIDYSIPWLMRFLPILIICCIRAALEQNNATRITVHQRERERPQLTNDWAICIRKIRMRFGTAAGRLSIIQAHAHQNNVCVQRDIRINQVSTHNRSKKGPYTMLKARTHTR